MKHICILTIHTR